MPVISSPNKSAIMEKVIVKDKGTVDLNNIKEQIVSCIRDRYGMSVKDFSHSTHATKLKLNTRNLQNYLSAGATSLPTLNILCSHFGIGTLKRKVTVKRTETYSLTKQKKNGKKS